MDNKLSLHIGKPECILFGSKRKLRKAEEFYIECNGHKIKAQNSVKYLELNLDIQLSGEAIINNSVQKVNARLPSFYTGNVRLWKKNLGSQFVRHSFNVI